MPLPGAVRYRWKSYRGGKKVRLAFNAQNEVIEVKPKGGEAEAVTPKQQRPGRKKR